MSLRSAITLISITALTLAFSGCGRGNGSGAVTPEVTSVSVSPATAQVSTGQSQLFTTQVTGTGSYSTAVTWSVNGINGGNSTYGTVVGGKYTASSTVPSPSDVTVTATSVQSPTISGNSTVTVVASATVTSVSVNPATAQVPVGQSQAFTAQVAGTGAYSTAVTWSVNGINGGNNTYGTITAGEYTAPSTVPNPSNVTVTATSVQSPTISGNSTVTVLSSAAVLNSITPSSASAGDVLTVDANFYGGVIETPQMIFSGPNGSSVYSTFQTANGLTVTVPFGATSGPVYISVPPQPGSGASTITSNSLPFTRLPNLLLHAPSKDLSSGESEQFEYRLLGASTPNVVKWTSDSGTINSSGLFTAPSVSSESYTHIKGCLKSTDSCDTMLLRILPFLITPTDPIVGLGDTLQLEAVQGSSMLSPTWSVLAGGGTINSAGVYTAPTATASAGYVPVQGQSGSTTEQAGVAVSGAFPGLVNRIYDYADFKSSANSNPPEARFVESVAVNGNRAYTISVGNPSSLTPSYQALNVYDITNPDAPLWIDAGEAASNSPAQLFSYGNTLFILDLSNLVVYSLAKQVPAVTEIVPVPPYTTAPRGYTFSNGVLYLNTAAAASNNPTSVPVDVFDFTSGGPVHTSYALPEPSQGGVNDFVAVSGNQNTIYGCWLEDVNNTPMLYIGTYDISQHPPTLVSTTVSTFSEPPEDECHLQVVGNLLFANSWVYDISNVTPVQVGTVPNPLTFMWGTEGNELLASGGIANYGASANYVVLDLNSSTLPVVKANVVDLPNANIMNPIDAAWANSNTFYSADGNGGIAVYDVSASGGPATVSAQELFSFTFAQAINQKTLYSASQHSAVGGLACLDVSGPTPVLEGSLYYSNNYPSAVQVSGTTVFLGLTNYLKIIDASNPAAPVEVGSVFVPVSALALVGNDLYVSTTAGQLIVYDVTNAASPTQLSSASMPQASTMSSSGTLLLVAAGTSGLLVYDISNPSAPTMRSQYLPSGGVPVWDALSPAPGKAILAADSDGLIILNLANPSSPEVLGQAQLPFANPFPTVNSSAGILTAFTLAYQNGLAYVGAGDEAIIFTYDLSVPSEPRIMAMNIISPYGLDLVPAITPLMSNLYTDVFDGAGESQVVQLDITIPQNSIELYFPPAALSNATPITGDLSKAKTRMDVILEMAKQQSSRRNRTATK